MILRVGCRVCGRGAEGYEAEEAIYMYICSNYIILRTLIHSGNSLQKVAFFFLKNSILNLGVLH